MKAVTVTHGSVWNGVAKEFRELLNKSGRAAMRIKIVKCDDSRDGGGRATSGTVAEARNAVNIGNIYKFRNEVVGDFELEDTGHDLFRGSLALRLKVSINGSAST